MTAEICKYVIEKEPTSPEDAGRAIDLVIRHYMIERNEKDYEVAFNAVWPLLPQRLRDTYAGFARDSGDLERISTKLEWLAEQIDALERTLLSQS